MTRKWHNPNLTTSLTPKCTITDITKLKISLKSVLISLKLVIAYRALRCKWFIVTLISVIVFSRDHRLPGLNATNVSLVCAWDFNMILKFNLCFALKHKFELAYYKHVISVYKIKLPIRFILIV